LWFVGYNKIKQELRKEGANHKLKKKKKRGHIACARFLLYYIFKPFFALR